LVREPAAVAGQAAVVRELVPAEQELAAVLAVVPEQELVRQPAVAAVAVIMAVLVGEVFIPAHTVGLTRTD
jgi:hypothetical protein